MPPTDSPRAGPAWLDERLRDGQVVIIDGATGTELEARGVSMLRFGWSARAQLDRPDILRRVHADYIEAGADVIITNTFAAARHLLEPGGLGEEVGAINRRAVEIAREARDEAADRPVAIAGSISNYMADSEDPYWLDPARQRATYREQAELLAEAGVDLIACEMMQRPDMSVPALEAAIDTGLPVWLGFACQRSAPGGSLHSFDYPEQSFEEMVDSVIDLPVGLVCVMHTPVPHTSEALEAVKRRWRGPLGAYPEAGYFEEPNWRFVEIDDGALVAAARRWRGEGVQVFGGCCGLGVAQIRALAEGLATR